MYDYFGIDVKRPEDNTPINQLAAYIRDAKRAFCGQLLSGQTFEGGVAHGDAVYFDGDTQTWRPALASLEVPQTVDGFAIPSINAVTVSALLYGPWDYAPGTMLYLSATQAGKLTGEETSYMVGRALGGGMIVFAAGAALAKVEADKAQGWGKRAEIAAVSAEAAAVTATFAMDNVKGIADDAVADVNDSRELAMAELRDLAAVTTTTLTDLYAVTEANVKALVEEFTALVSKTGETYAQLIEETADFARDSINNTVNAATTNLEASSTLYQNRLVATGNAQTTRVQALGTQVSGGFLALSDAEQEELTTMGDRMLGEMRTLSATTLINAQDAKDAADRAVAVAGVDLATPTKAGLVKAGVPGTNVDLAADATLSVEFDRLVSRPSITAAATMAVGYKYQIDFSASALVPERTVSKFIISFNRGTEIEVTATDNAGSYEWTAAGIDQSVTLISVTAYDNLNYRSDTNLAYVTVKVVKIAKPMITNPTLAEKDVPLFPAIQMTAFAATGMPATPEYTQVQIATADTFAEGTVVVDSGTSTAYSTAYLVATQLNDDTPYFVRARHSASFYGWSEWAEVVPFRTIEITIATPIILSPANGATSIALITSIAVSAIITTGVNDTGLYTQLQVATEDTFATPVFDTGETGVYKLTIAPTQLLPNAQYYVRVRHAGSTVGWSAWSAITAFATIVASMVKPSVIAPVEGATQIALTPVLQFSGPASSGMSDVFTSTQVQVSGTDTFEELLLDTGPLQAPTTSHTIATGVLTYNGTYFVRVRHQGTVLGWSAWSATRSFATIIAKVSQVIVTAPTEQQVDVSRTPVILLSAFANVGPVDSASGTQIQLSRLSDFSALVLDTGMSAPYATSLAVADNQKLLNLTRYYLRARHKGALFGWGDWSVTRIFTTLNQEVSTPTVLAPAANAVDQIVSGLKVVTSTPAATNDTVTKWEVQVATDAAYATVIWQTGQVAIPQITEVAIPLSLSVSTAYYVRVRYQGENFGWTAWSATNKFTTLSAKVNTPSIQAPANGASSVDLQPTITVTGFSNVGPSDSGAFTDIQVSRTADFTSIIASYSSAYLTSWKVNVGLDLLTGYFIRARHKGVLWGYSDWSATVQFTTLQAYTNQANITAPPTAQTGLPLRPQFTFSARTNVGPADSNANTHFQLAKDANFTNLVVNTGENGPYVVGYAVGTDISIDTPLWARVRHKGTLWGWGAWSAVWTGRTVMALPTTPVITVPVEGASVGAGDLTLVQGQFTTTPPSSIPHEKAAWEITQNGKLVVGSGESTTDLQTWRPDVPEDRVSWGWSGAVAVPGMPGNWYGMTYRAGKFVVCGDNGKISTSTDGATWTSAVTVPGQSGTWYGITYGAGKFAVCGVSGKISTSIDGATWTSVIVPPGLASSWYGITYGAGKFVVCGYNGRIAASTDGVTWTSAIVPPGQTPYWWGIAYAAGKFVVCGVGGKISTSADGVTWTSAVTVPGQANTWYGITYAAGKFAICGDYGLVSTSIDGVTWTSVVTVPGQDSRWYGIAYGAGKFVVCGERGKISTSTDGVTWTSAVATQGQTSYWRATAYAAGKFVVCGDGGKASVKNEGAAPVMAWGGAVAVPGQDSLWSGLAYGAGKFVICGNNGKVSTSTDGVTWTSVVAVPGQTGAWSRLAYGAGKFVICGNNGKVSTSTDGVTWTSVVAVPGHNSYWQGIAYGAGKFVVCGSEGKVSTSTDGVTWTTAVAVPGQTSYWYGITYGAGKFVVCGDGGKASTSTAGVTWTPAVGIPGQPFVWYEITYSNGKFGVCGDNGKISTSTDGVTWTSAVVTTGMTGAWLGITYGAGRFAVCGSEGRASTSTDGVTWTSAAIVPGQTDHWYGITYGNGRFVVCGYGGKVSVTTPYTSEPLQATVRNKPQGLAWSEKSAPRAFSLVTAGA